MRETTFSSLSPITFLCAALLFVRGAPARAGVDGPLAAGDHAWWACEVRSQIAAGPYICSGVLVGPRTILTAKHCLTGSPSSVDVWCGGRWVAGPASWNYPDTSGETTSDIALLTVSQDFWYSPQYAPRLPDSSKASAEILKSGINCTTWGFGYGPDGALESLRYQRVLDANKGSSPSFMNNSPTATRPGDSGGPVVCLTGDADDYDTAKKTIVAITSGGTPGKDWMLRVDPFRSWICASLSNGGACRADQASMPTAPPARARRDPVQDVDPGKVFGE